MSSRDCWAARLTLATAVMLVVTGCASASPSGEAAPPASPAQPTATGSAVASQAPAPGQVRQLTVVRAADHLAVSWSPPDQPPKPTGYAVTVDTQPTVRLDGRAFTYRASVPDLASQHTVTVVAMAADVEGAPASMAVAAASGDGSGGGSGGGTATQPAPPGQPAPAQPSTVTAKGKFILYGGDSSYAVEQRDGALCWGDGGYDDIDGGAAVTVTDQNGTVIGAGQLGPGSYVVGNLEAGKLPKCVFGVVVPGLPTTPTFYGITVTHRGTIQFRRDELDGFVLSLGL